MPERATWKQAVVLLPAQVLARGTEALLPLALAVWFGRSDSTDAYWATHAIFLFVLSLLAGAFQDSAIVPVLTELRLRSKDEHRHATSALLGRALALGTILGILFVGVAATYFAIVAPRLKTSQFLLPYALLAPAIAIRSLSVGILQSRGRLQDAPIASAFGAAVQIGLVFLLKDRIGIAIVPFSQFASETCATIVLRRRLSQDDSVSLVPSLEKSPAVTDATKLVRSEVLGAALTRINLLVDQGFALTIGQAGSVTLMKLASDVATVPTTLVQATLLQVIFVALSRDSANKDLLAFRRRAIRGSLELAIALALSMAPLILFRRPLVEAIFHHGKMDPSGIALLTELLPWALVNVPPFGVLLFLVRCNVSLKNTRVMLPAGALNATCNLALNAALAPKLGLAGVLLGTAITHFLICLLLGASLRSALRREVLGVGAPENLQKA